MLIVKSTYFKAMCVAAYAALDNGRPRRAGCYRWSLQDHHDPPNLDYPHETAATISGSIEGIGMVSRTCPTSSGSRELRLPVETGIQNVRYIFERFGAKIVNNNQFLGIIF